MQDWRGSLASLILDLFEQFVEVELFEPVELFLIVDSLLLICDSNLVDFQLALCERLDLTFIVLCHVLFCDVCRDSFITLNRELALRLFLVKLSDFGLKGFFPQFDFGCSAEGDAPLNEWSVGSKVELLTFYVLLRLLEGRKNAFHGFFVLLDIFVFETMGLHPLQLVGKLLWVREEELEVDRGCLLAVSEDTNESFQAGDHIRRSLGLKDFIDAFADQIHSLASRQLLMDFLALIVEWSWVITAACKLFVLCSDLFFTCCDSIDCRSLITMVLLKTVIESVLSFSCFVQLDVETIGKNLGLLSIFRLICASVVEILLPSVTFLLNEFLQLVQVQFEEFSSDSSPI